MLSHSMIEANTFSGAGTGGLTKSLIKQLGTAFATYTFTDISSGFFEPAREVFHDYKDSMIFKMLDLEKDPIEQGFKEHSYDVVIASLVLHATSNLENSLKNVRRLLKPGGYLAMLEITNVVTMRMSFYFGGLPGWWLGRDDGRELNPCVSADHWDMLLRKTGFSGTDAITPDLDPMPWPVSVIVAQAVDERVDILRQPLSTPMARAGGLTLIGGATERTLLLANELEEILQNHYQEIIRFKRIEDFEFSPGQELLNVLCLSDLDTPVFQGLTEERFGSFRTMLDRCRNVLWVSQGARSDNPYAAMTVGFGRTVAHELPNVRLQFLDHGPSEELNSKSIAENLLRLHFSESLENDEGNTKLLWSVEPEMAIEQGKLLIPRVMPNRERNDRYNSGRRPIKRDVACNSAEISVIPTKDSYSLLDSSRQYPRGQAQDRDRTVIQAKHSFPFAVRLTKDCSLFVTLGHAHGSTGTFIAVSDTLASSVEVPGNWTAACQFNDGDENTQLISVVYELLSQYIVASSDPGAAIVLHEAPPLLATTVKRHATGEGKTVILTTSKLSKTISEEVYIHPHSPVRAVRRQLPANISVVVNLASEDDLIGILLREQFSSENTFLSTETLLGFAATSPMHGSDTVATLLKTAIKPPENIIRGKEGLGEISVVPLRDLSGMPRNLVMNTVIDWTTGQTIPVQVEPVDSHMTFKSDRTYLLFGLAGQLGRSITQWMISRGAKHVVLTSRKPAVDPRWIEKMRALGGDVRIIAK